MKYAFIAPSSFKEEFDAIFFSNYNIFRSKMHDLNAKEELKICML